jgi:ABC-type glycerol-3-phosphate transport system permease component
MTFLTNWNDFVFPLIFINKDRLKTIQLGLANFIGPRSADYTQLMAGLVISIIPILVLYFTFQNSLVKGMTAGAVKG